MATYYKIQLEDGGYLLQEIGDEILLENIFEDTGQFTANSAIMTLHISSYTGDASLKGIVSTTYDGDSSLMKTVEEIMLSDSNLKIEINEVYTGNTNLLITVNDSFTGNASLLKIINDTYTGNASFPSTSTIAGTATLRTIKYGSPSASSGGSQSSRLI